jgi:hypothetical protein
MPLRIVKQLASIVYAMHRPTVVLDRFAVPFGFQQIDAQRFSRMEKWYSVQDL